jgi:ribosomal protein S18 acetylase RimI-like enzyme
MRIAPVRLQRGWVVRQASSGDALALESLYASLAPPVAPVRVLPARLAEIEEDPHTLLLVLSTQDTICGSAMMTLCLDAMFQNQPFAVIENVVVAPESRRSGAASALLEELERMAIERDCSKILLASGVERVPAHAFFRSRGYDQTLKRAFVKYRSWFRTGSGSA